MKWQWNGNPKLIAYSVCQVGVLVSDLMLLTSFEKLILIKTAIKRLLVSVQIPSCLMLFFYIVGKYLIILCPSLAL